MTRRTGLIFMVVALISMMLVIPVRLTSAAADTAGTTCKARDRRGVCTVFVHGPGSGAGGGAGHGSSQSNCTSGGAPISCKSPAGTWSATHACYIQLTKPPPPDSDPRWGPAGRIALDVLYTCTSPAGRVSYFTDNGLRGIVIVNPVTVARDAMAKMNLRAIQIGMAPRATPAYGLVGLPVWMWTANPSPATVGPLSTSATTGPVTVTAKASLDEIDWSMGDGQSVVCHGAGTPYSPSFGNIMSPTCGYRYTRASTSTAGGVYHVAARSHWTITWAGGGAAGTVHLDFTSRAQVQIRELQVVVTN